MHLAVLEAKKGMIANRGGPFGCVIVKNNKVIAKSHNKVLLKQDPTAHGEIETIKLACKKLKTFDLTGCILYTTGFPCPMCMGACKWAHIKKVYYGCNPTDTAKIGFDDKKFYEWMLEANCVSRKECLELYKQYSKKKDKKHY